MDRPTVAVVGHGPSLTKLKVGEEIDSADVVVRFKWHSELTRQPEHWGSRTDIVVCSLKVMPRVREHWPDVDKFIVFSDSRTQGYTEKQCQKVRDKFRPKVAVLDKPLCDFWDHRYRDLVPEGEEHEPHTSAGFHCLMYLGKHFPNADVTLYGFDSLATGEWTWSITRGEDWDYPKHRFDVEHQMLPDLAAVYNMTIQAVMPDKGESE